MSKSRSNKKFMDIRRTDFPDEVKNLIDEDDLKASVLEEAQRNAAKIANREFNEGDDEVNDYSGIILSPDEVEEYLLVLEFMESIGLKFAPAVLRYESQHPEVTADRRELAEKLSLKARSEDPLLVQLFQERIDMVKNRK